MTYSIALSPKPIVPTSPWIPADAIEEIWHDFERSTRIKLGKLILKPIKERIEGVVLMAGSLGFDLMKSTLDEAFGATAYTAVTPLYFGLWNGTLTAAFEGNTTGESAYTSYARLSLTNNTTIFAAGSGTTTYTKTFPSDALKSWATSTGTGTNNTINYLGILSGNAGTTADKGYAWCSVTATTINTGDTPQLAQNAVTLVQS